MRASSVARPGLAAFATAAVVFMTPAAPGWAAPLPLTLSSTGGPSGGGNSLTGTVAATSANPSPFPAGSQPVVQFQYNGAGATTCSAKAKAVAPIAGTSTALTGGVLTVDPADVLRISPTKIAFTVPSSSYPATVADAPSTVNTGGLVLLEGQKTSKWNVCVYDSASTTDSTLIAATSYTLAVRPKISAILPATSPAYGGQLFTVNGTGFGTGSTATIDNVPVTNVKLAANGNSFTAVAPAHAPGTGYALVVKTPGGLVSSADPDNDGKPADGKPETTADEPIPFAFSNGISITPNTAAPGSRVNIEVRGVGFDKLTFSKAANATPVDATAHVFLVEGKYVPASNRGVQECTGVLVVSSTELVCTLDLGADSLNPADSSTVADTAVAEGTYTVTVVANGSRAATAEQAAATALTSGSTFTVAPY